jgi:hypothetical protein
MNERERRLLDALVTPLNKMREPWERGEIVVRAPSPRVASAPTPAAEPCPKRAKADRKKRNKEKLPRGIRRRGNSLVVYLTFPDGHAERRSLGNVSVGMAKEQRHVWQREIKEGRYIKRAPRPEPVEPVSFSQIADKEVERARNYKSEWATDESRVRLLKEWWGGRPASSVSPDEIEARLLKNMAPPPDGLSWSESTSDDYRDLLGRIYGFAVERGEVSVNPAAKVHRHNKDEDRARTRELSYAEEERFRKAIRKLCPEKGIGIRSLPAHWRTPRQSVWGFGERTQGETGASVEGR